MHVLDYFQKIYVVNLPHRQDRRQEMEVQLNGVGLSLTSPGVCLFEAVRPDAPEGFPSIGARGCFLSHLGILRDASRHQLDRILILEDDLNFVADFSSRIGDVVSQLKSSDWSIFYGGYHIEPVLQPSSERPLLEVPGSQAIQTTHFVGFQGAAIREAVEYLEGILSRLPGDPNGGPMHVDGAYCWFRNQFPARKTLLAAPELGYQRSSRTDISELRWFDRVPGVRGAANWLRSRRNKTR